MPRTFQENLALYAELAVRGGVVLQPGQELILRADIQDAEFARLVVKAAYKAGAKNVQVMFSDEQCALIRYQEGSDEAMQYAPKWMFNATKEAFDGNAASLVIFGQDPNLLKEIPPMRIAEASKAQSIAGKEVGEYVSQFRINWSIVGAPQPAWAKMVFPNDDEATAMKKLWDAIFLVSRVLEEDPLAAWSAHCDALDRRREWLNRLGVSTLHFKGPGTDLHVGLAEGAIWLGGWGHSANGVQCGPNIPTEEVFTMPHRSRVNGIVSSTKPLSVRGQVVDGISVEFTEGAVTKATAKSGEETFLQLIDTDEGARRLGEVALVPNSCKVAEAGILFFNTLYDENAASHIAMGRCYANNMKDYVKLSPEEQAERGANDSLIHVDWMIGSKDVDVDGILADGSVHPLMKSGEWVEAL